MRPRETALGHCCPRVTTPFERAERLRESWIAPGLRNAPPSSRNSQVGAIRPLFATMCRSCRSMRTAEQGFRRPPEKPSTPV